jgi:transcriptional regulator of aromatic amino acid metabolism
MRYLIQTQEVYRADTDVEAQGLITEAKQAGEYELAKYSSEKKEVKAKGEIIDEFYKVTLTKLFTDIKEPGERVTITYEVD